MRCLSLRGGSETQGTDLRLEAVECENGKLLDGYIRVSYVRNKEEVGYVGYVSPRRLRQFVLSIEKRDAALAKNCRRRPTPEAKPHA